MQKIPTHGGSIRVYASKSNKYKINNSVNKILKEEKNILHLTISENLEILL